jgi:hypothetical protein
MIGVRWAHTSASQSVCHHTVYSRLCCALTSWHAVNTISNKASFISDEFEGQVRSVLHIASQQDSITLQPFYVLPLDIMVRVCLSVCLSVHVLLCPIFLNLSFERFCIRAHGTCV